MKMLKIILKIVIYAKNYKKFNYVMNIIDHYSKLLGSHFYKKTAKNVLYGINEFISLYREPSNLHAITENVFKNTI